MSRRERSARSLCALVALGLALSCGYRPAREVEGGDERFVVVEGVSHAADPLAMAALVEGARGELARRGVLGKGSERLVVDVVSIGEESSGILANAGVPLARGSSLSLTAHGALRRDRGAPELTASKSAGDESLDLGDATISMEVAAESSTSTDALRRDDAVREMAARAGRELASRAIHRASEISSPRAVAPTPSQ